MDLSCGGRFAAIKGFGPNRVDIRSQGDASLTRKKESPSKFLNFGTGCAIKEEELWDVAFSLRGGMPKKKCSMEQGLQRQKGLSIVILQLTHAPWRKLPSTPSSRLPPFLFGDDRSILLLLSLG